MSKTKIVCTIGPSSQTPEIITRMIQSGMNVARLNFSHGTHADHLEKIRLIRMISDQLEKPVAILQDLCGQKIRVGSIREPGIRLKSGEQFILTSQLIEGAGNRVPVSYRNLPGEVKPDDRIMLADGLMELIVEKTTDTEIFCRVITGGLLTSNKGINLPSGSISAESITEKDKVDLMLGLANDVDYVALSFVRSAADVLKIREIIHEQGKNTPVIAKIEKHEALNHVDEIMDVSDGIMVARGDLGVEIPLEQVPGIQKMLIRRANALGKPVIIATQMLRSMVDSPRPTRAEAADVANAVLDGADAVMLSEETASGDFPVKAVQYMVRIAKDAERYFPHKMYLQLRQKKEISESVAYATCILADNLEATAILATTRSGFTARQISRFRPIPDIIALSPDKKVIRSLALYWGCIPVLFDDISDTDRMIEVAADTALKTGKVHEGDLVVITAGHPLWVPGTTNMVKVKKL
ncbi:MAG: pyruvate kinase [Desulfobacterales bacterium]|nr:pyruvate kinase [Desulfobacterales bacterium]MDD4071152.1 pyruvate kinase [Desulfobacterales bacterium]MDD4392588.1 pyruvate kinase [Desulfobacterales bacterium]